LDHTKWLGASPELIAAEKAGIIKEGRPTVSAAQLPGVRRVLREAAASHKSEITFVETPWEGNVSLCGFHQKHNAALAVQALAASGLVVSREAITNGLSNVYWPGRFQRVGDHWILDGAHNPHSAGALTTTWRQEFGSCKVPVIFGCLSDKDVSSLLATVESIASEFHFVPVANERTVSPDHLTSLTSLPSTVHTCPEKAVNALSRATSPVLITGSLFLVGEILPLITASRSPKSP
jgi:dihydrofolate synthase/folylpolyglutamate synthase